MTTSNPNGQHPQQLPLLDDLDAVQARADVALQFRLDQRTRQRGLAHIAAIKAQLSARAEQRQSGGQQHSQAA
jgi:hypothetical protein